jgi:DNA-binding protein HU-beta
VTKADIIVEITQRTTLTKEDVQQVVEEFFEVVKTKMEEGDSLYIRGFGSFVNKYRARKVARDISKGTPIVIEPHYIPSFKPAKGFSDRIRESEKMQVLATEQDKAKQATAKKRTKKASVKA